MYLPILVFSFLLLFFRIPGYIRKLSISATPKQSVFSETQSSSAEPQQMYVPCGISLVFWWSKSLQMSQKIRVWKGSDQQAPAREATWFYICNSYPLHHPCKFSLILQRKGHGFLSNQVELCKETAI